MRPASRQLIKNTIEEEILLTKTVDFLRASACACYKALGNP